MHPVDAGNPYRAPQASVAAVRSQTRRPPVYTAISLLCWATGAFHLVGCLLVMGVGIRNSFWYGWDKAFRPGDTLAILLLIILGMSSTLSYLTAGQWLRTNRGRPGLILCGVAIGMTYLIVWIANRP